ncbi:DoxX family membrane protein [Occallatibacter savannae]|uniref:DoxX family membrane protein n=1 Tax=Occallatibacter savannae TaxID=1002691 RepID=UPI001EF47D98|nr:DoxX family membrane protein [Occallatibacter savannae]
MALFAIGLIGMGVLGSVYGDFAMGWQPVAPWFPARTALAYVSAVLMIGCGAALFFPSTTKWALRTLLPYLVLWQMLKFPALVVAPKMEAVYLGFGELAVLLAGGWTLFARLGDAEETRFAWAGGERAVRWSRYYLAVWIVPIGLSHMLYTKPTMDLIPAYFPDKIFWAYLTGLGQIASGLGLLFGVFPRIAAWAEAIQISLYALLIWLPAILLNGKNLGPTFVHADRRLSFTAFLISWIIAAGAWAVAQNTPSKYPGKK